MNSELNKNEDKKKTKTVFFIDKEKFEVEVEELTVKQLLEDYAKEDTSKTTLGLKDGNAIEKFTDLARKIPLKDGMKFVVFHNEPTPVS